MRYLTIGLVQAVGVLACANGAVLPSLSLSAVFSGIGLMFLVVSVWLIDVTKPKE